MASGKIVLKSLSSEITSHEDIYNFIGYAIDNQHEFERRIVSPYENNDWDFFKTFTIDVEKIDRLYDIECSDRIQIDSDYACQIYCRLYFENNVYYVNMYAHTDSLHGWECKLCSIGVIYFTKSPVYFYNHVICNDFDVFMQEKILNSLFEDGFKIPVLDSQYHISPKNRRNVASLKLLCHENIYTNLGLLYNYKTELPQILARSVTEYIDFKLWNSKQ